MILFIFVRIPSQVLGHCYGCPMLVKGSWMIYAKHSWIIRSYWYHQRKDHDKPYCIFWGYTINWFPDYGIYKKWLFGRGINYISIFFLTMTAWHITLLLTFTVEHAVKILTPFYSVSTGDLNHWYVLLHNYNVSFLTIFCRSTTNGPFANNCDCFKIIYVMFIYGFQKNQRRWYSCLCYFIENIHIDRITEEYLYLCTHWKNSDYYNGVEVLI